MERIIKLTHKDMNEYIKMYAEKYRGENPDETQSDANSFKFKQEEVDFLISVLDEIVPDDVRETEIIANIKNTLQSSLETKNNEKR